MDTSCFNDDLADLPISCTLCLVQEGVIGPGWLWELSPTRGLVQSSLYASPGMMMTVSVQVPGMPLIRREGLVTWARESEFGMEWLHSPAGLIEKGVLHATPR